MAISFVGSMAPVGANNGGNVTLTFTGASGLLDTGGGQATLQQGDVVVCAYACSDTADHAMSTSSSGWTEISPEVFANAALDTNLAAYWKVMGASPDTTFVAVGPTGNSNATIAVAFAFRDAHQTTPFSVAATTATGTGTTVANPASITPTTAGSWPICIGAGAAAAGAVYTVPASLSATTNHFRSGNHAETNDIAIGMGIKTDWSSGAFDCAAFGGGNVNASNSWGAISLVLEPAPSTQDLTPSLFTNTQTFHAPTVAASNTLTPSLVTNVSVFHAPTVAQPPWDPSILGSAVKMWLTTKENVTNTGGNVSAWLDKSASALSYEQSDAGRRPAYAATGWDGTRPSIYFDGVSTFDYLTSTANFAPISQPFWVFAVVKTWTTGPILRAADGNNASLNKYAAGNVGLFYGGSVASAMADTGKYIVGAKGDGTSSELWQDATLDGTTTDAGTQTLGSTSTAMTLGFNGGGFLDAEIGEILVVSGSLTTNQRQEMEGYLAREWGLEAQLPPGHPYGPLAPSLLVNSQTFYAATVAPGSVGLTPSLFSGSQSFHAPTVLSINILTPSLFSNSISFHAATVTPGAVGLTPNLFSNPQSFHAATVGRGAVALAPGLYSNTPSFPSATVTPGAVALTASRLDESQSFYSATVDIDATNLTPSLMTNTNSFNSPTVTVGPVNLSASHLDNVSSFHSATVAPGSVGLTAPLLSGSQSFHTPTVSVGAVNLTPSLYSNASSFHSATITAGTVSLNPALFSNSAAFYAATVTLGPGPTQDLTPNLSSNTSSFYAATVGRGAVDLTASLFSNSQVFNTPVVELGGSILTANRLVNVSSFYDVTVIGNQQIIPQRVGTINRFYRPEIALYVSYADELGSRLVATKAIERIVGTRSLERIVGLRGRRN